MSLLPPCAVLRVPPPSCFAGPGVQSSLCRPVFMEYEAVCTRPEHLAASGLSNHQLGLFLDGLASFVHPVEVHFLWRPQLRDPADELVLEAAVNASVRALVTFNQKHFAGVAQRFQLEVLTPGEFLRSLP